MKLVPRHLTHHWAQKRTIRKTSRLPTCGSDSSPSSSLKRSSAPNFKMAVSSSLLKGFELHKNKSGKAKRWILSSSEVYRPLLAPSSCPNSHLLGPARTVVQNSPARSVHSLDHKMVQHHLLLGSLNDLFFHRPLGHQAVNVHLEEQEHRERGKKQP